LSNSSQQTLVSCDYLRLSMAGYTESHTTILKLRMFRYRLKLVMKSGLACLVFLGWSVLWAQSILEDYALVMNDPPLAQQVSSRKELRSASSDRLAVIQSKQQRMRESLESRQIPVVGAAQTLVNAVFVRASREQLGSLESLPGVK